MARLTKPQQFITSVVGILTEYGAVEDLDASPNCREFLWNTVHGPLRVMVYGDWLPTRFEGKEAIASAAQAVGCNPYSGKWNCHFDKKLPVDKQVEIVRGHLRTVAP